MASQLALAHVEGQRRIRVAAVQGVGNIWGNLPGYDKANLDEWLARVVPHVQGAQRQAIALTRAYLARATESTVGEVDITALLVAARNGATPEAVYTRPMVTMWSELGEGKLWADAASVAAERARSAAAMDCQLAMRDTLGAVGKASDGYIWGYQRVADGSACDYCLELDGAQFTTDEAMPLHNYCIVGSSAVWVPSGSGAEATNLGGAHAATRRRYEGEVVVVDTAAGHQLAVTPNHPILTSYGWISAGLLREGDSVVRCRDFKRVCGSVPDEQHMPTRIEDAFRAGMMAALVSVPLSSENFHGDGVDANVDVVALDGRLGPHDLAELLQPSDELALRRRLSTTSALASGRGLRQRGLARRSASSGIVCRTHAGLALGGGFAHGPQAVLGRYAAQCDALLEQVGAYRSSVNAQGTGKGCDGFPFEVALDSVLHTRRIDFSGHVYNLITNGGWYVTDGILTHNCGCGAEPVVYARGENNANALSAYNAAVTPPPAGVAINQHGELGPVLGAPGGHFMDQAQAEAR